MPDSLTSDRQRAQGGRTTCRWRREARDARDFMSGVLAGLACVSVLWVLIAAVVWLVAGPAW